MHTKIKYFISLFIGLILGLTLLAGPKAPFWKAGETDLPLDPKVTFGTLDNGMSYAILKHQDPPERVSMRLYIDAGSLMEEPGELGLAHFIEHLAFQGSEHFPEGELVEYLQRIGMGFGADTNAHTGFKETVYKLELPSNTPDYLNDGFNVMYDYASALTFPEEKIASERGVILAEKRDRDNADYRVMQEGYWKFIAQGTRMPERFPIGEEADIKSVSREDFMRFYNTWYTPNRMALIVVGDIEPEAIEEHIKSQFGAIAPKPYTEDPGLGELLKNRGLVAQVHTEPEVSSAEVNIQVVMPFSRDHFNRFDMQEYFCKSIAADILNRRLVKLAKQEDAAFISGSTHSFDLLNWARISYISLDCEPGNWEASLATAEQELRRALEYGFTSSELSQAKARILDGFKENVEAYSTSKSSFLASSLSGAISKNMPYMSVEDEYDLLQETLVTLTPKLLLDTFKKFWDSPDTLVFVSSNEPIEGGSDKALEVYSASTSVPVEALEDEEVPTFAYLDFGPEGSIVSQKYIQDLGIHQIRFSNNVLLNIKETTFEANSISIGINVGHGLLSEPKDKVGLSFLADNVFISGGLGKHSIEDMKKIMSGRRVSFSFDVGPESFSLGANTNQEDLLFQLQILTSYLIDPGYRPDSLRQAHKNFDVFYRENARVPQGVFSNQVLKFLASGDPRFGFPEQPKLMDLTLEDVKKWLDPALREQVLEVSIVGDLLFPHTVEAVAKTLGALPKRQDVWPLFLDERQVYFPSDSKRAEFPFQTAIPKAIAAIAWPTADKSDIQLVRRLHALASILSNEMDEVLRNQMGQAYSPYAHNKSSRTFPRYGFMYAIAFTDPSQTESVLRATEKIGEGFQKNGITQDQFDRAMNPIYKNLEQQVRSNGYWLGSVLMHSRQYPQQLDWARSMVEDYSAIERITLEELARTYLSPNQALRLIVSPEGEDSHN